MKNERDIKVQEPDKPKEVEPLMGVEEFSLTRNVNPVLMAGFKRYCALNKIPPRMTEKQWQMSLNTWSSAPATV